MNRGLATFDSASAKEHKYQNLSQQLLQKQRGELETQLQVFQNALISFKEQHQHDLASNPQLRAEFGQICSSFGIDPLVVSSQVDEEEKNNQLALRIIEICKLSKNLNGGLILVDDLIRLINNYMGLASDLKLDIGEKDIVKALDHLHSLGDELQLVTIGRRKYIKSTTQEITEDQNLIFSAADVLGYVSVGILRDNFGWKTVRCRSNLDDLVSSGVLWVDEQAEGETQYWILQGSNM